MKKSRFAVVWIIMVLVSFLPDFTGAKVKAATAADPAPVVYWEGAKLVKGQMGKIDILKPLNLWKRDSNQKLMFERVLKPGESYRVYQYSSLYGGQYGVGGPYFITNVKGYVQYKTPSRLKLMQVNPELYRTKLTIGTVSDEQTTVIAPGVTQSKLTVTGNDVKQSIYVMNIEQNAPQIKLETTLAKNQMVGFETVSSMAKRNQADGHYVIGAVNGDYFSSDGSPTDLTVVNGEVITTNTTPASDRTIFGVNPTGKAMIGNPDINLTVTVNGQNAYPINSINKRRFTNHLVLYTPRMASTTMTNDLGTEVVLTNVQGQLNGNNTVKATVKEVMDGKGNKALNQGEMILSGHGLGSNFLKTVKAGDSLEINLSYSDPNWNLVDQALGGRYHLVSNGQTQAFSIAGAHPRTAIGIKKDGSVFTTVIDGRQENSSGVTLTQLAGVMKDLGAVEAMTFDGGGSSTMVVRQPGDADPALINSPSDGRERSVANSLMVVGLWQAGPLNRLLLSAKEVKVIAGATYANLNITPKGLDKNNNLITITDPLTWSSTSGTFNPNGSFTAGSTIGKGTVTAVVGPIKASVPIEVINKLDSLKVATKTVMVEKNGIMPLPVDGYLNGVKMVSDPSIYTYTLSGNIGTIDKGVFKAGNRDGIITVKVSYGTVSTEFQVMVGNPGSIILEDFEGDLSSWKVSGSQYQSIQVSPEKYYVKEGKRSLKLAYDFSGTIGTSGVYAIPGAAIDIPGAPVKIGMWVYGDGKGHWLRAQLVDAKSNSVQLDFTKNLDWVGWQYVEAVIPAGLTAPYKLDMPIRYMEVNEAAKNKGQIFIDQISAVY